jgi:hypothetical protein
MKNFKQFQPVNTPHTDAMINVFSSRAGMATLKNHFHPMFVLIFFRKGVRRS